MGLYQRFDRKVIILSFIVIFYYLTNVVLITIHCQKQPNIVIIMADDMVNNQLDVLNSKKYP